MDEIIKAFDKLNKRQTYSQIALAADVSRNTILNVRRNPASARLSTLKKIFKAMGYRLELKLIPIKD
jgi:DNA-binding phage protein